MARSILMIGVVAAILANATQALGLVFQRKAECSQLSKAVLAGAEGSSGWEVYRNRRWQVGLVLFLVANLLGSVIQIATLPLIVLAPLQASGLVFNSFFSHLLLKEPFPMVPTVLVCIGGTIMAFMACTFINTPLTHTYEELCELATAPGFVRYFIWTNVVAMGSLVSSFVVNRRRVKGLLLVFTSGTWSAHALLIAKCLADVIATEWSVSLHTVLLFFGLVTLSLTQLFLLNRGLSHLSTSILYPFVFSIYNLVTVLNSTMFYHDSLVPHTAQFLYPGLFFGFVVLSLGVFSISVALQRFEDALVHGMKSNSPNAAALSYGSINHGRPLSDEFTEETNTYTSLSV